MHLRPRWPRTNLGPEASAWDPSPGLLNRRTRK